MEDKIKILNDKIALAKLGAGEKRIAALHAKKRLQQESVSNIY